MRWQGRRQSDNIEFRNSSGTGKKVGIGGFITVIIGLLVWWITGDPSQILQLASEGVIQQNSDQPPVYSDKDKATIDFLSVVLAETEDIWSRIFNENGMTYRMPTMVFFRDAVSSACGNTTAQAGPFYCLGDERVYIDIDFIDKLQNYVGAQGDFVQAYIVAHEVGHHIQKLTGVLQKVNERRESVSEVEMNDLTIRLELQADFYAGVWAHYVEKYKDVLDKGDIDEAINAARAIGDDTLQKKAQGYIIPDSFTHGTSAQRVKWFRLGYETGDFSRGDTFSAGSSSDL